MVRDIYLIDILEWLERSTPKNIKGDAVVEYDLDRKAAAHNIEVIYHASSGRLAQLSYFIDMAATVNSSVNFKPSPPASERIRAAFYDYEELADESLQSLNTAMNAWVSNQVMRELCEFLHYYLLQVYEFCLINKYASKPIRLAQIESIREEVDKFEKSDLRDRLRLLRREAKIRLAEPHRQSITSLYKARNIFAHFDGRVQRKFCDSKKGVVEILWPKNSYHLHKRDGGKKVPYHKVRKPFSGHEYDQIIITWLGETKMKTYYIGERIHLETEQLHELIFFFVFIFSDIQKGLIQYAKNSGVEVRDFEAYGLAPSIGFIGEEELPIINEGK